MRTLSKRGTMHSVGNQIGVGKESGTEDEPVPTVALARRSRYEGLNKFCNRHLHRC